MLSIQVFFRAGVLGTMEELRDERLAKIITWMQSWIRGLIGRKEYGRLQEQRVSLVVLQRNIRKYMDMSNWSWFIFWQKVKPLINQPRIEDEINKLKDRAEKAVADLDRECTRRKELEESNVSLAEELNTLKETLESTKGNVSKFIEEQAKISAAKADLEAQLSVSNFILIEFNMMPYCFNIVLVVELKRNII